MVLDRSELIGHSRRGICNVDLPDWVERGNRLNIMASIDEGGPMPGRAYDVLKEFWANQDSGDYTLTEHLFAEDALFVDPIYGTFTGRHEITSFLDLC